MIIERIWVSGLESNLKKESIPAAAEHPGRQTMVRISILRSIHVSYTR